MSKTNFLYNKHRIASMGSVGLTVFLVGGSISILLDQFVGYLWWTGAVTVILALGISQSTKVGFLPEEYNGRWLLLHVLSVSSLSLAIGSAVTIFAMLAMDAGSGIVAALVDASGFVRRTSGKGLQILIATVVTGITGLLFFYFRLRQRFLYGLTEALVGVSIAAHRISNEPGDGLPSETGFYIAVLTAGVYLVVRGLDNMHQAIKCDDALWLWAWKRWASLRRLTDIPAPEEVQIRHVLRANTPPAANKRR